MSYFNRDSRSGGNRNFGRRSFGDRGNRQMFPATCSSCGKECQVPFKPTGSKPVFCSECFEKKGGGSDPKRFGARDRQPQNNVQLEAINTKLDKILAILAPVSVRPAKEQKIEKEIKIQPEKPIVVIKKRTKASKKTALSPAE